jgi:hypothetical protein
MCHILHGLVEGCWNYGELVEGNIRPHRIFCQTRS